jgi:hypothetical protein
LKISAIALARTLAYIETFDLDPKGRVYFPDLVSGVAERYRFAKFPTKPEDFNEANGIVFEDGKSGNKVIQKFTIFPSLLVVETRSNTTDSKLILEEMLVWGAAKFGLNYAPGTIRHYAYVSGVSFYGDATFLSVSRALQALSEKISTAVTDIWQEPIQYESVGIALGHDALSRKYALAQFTLTRRAETPFTENKYYSEAPLPTDLHIKFLEEFEREAQQARTA